MASPQRRPDPQQIRELEDMQHRDVQREIGPRWRFSFWWVWIAAFIAIWWVAFGWGNSGGYIWGTHGASVAQPANDAVIGGPGLPILNASAANKHTYAGQAFIIQNVPVERVASQHALWIGSAHNATPMLLVMPASGNAGNYAPGEWLNATGRIEKAPPAAQAQKQWGLTPADAQALETQGVYIQANSAFRALRK